MFKENIETEYCYTIADLMEFLESVAPSPEEKETTIIRFNQAKTDGVTVLFNDTQLGNEIRIAH